MKKFHNRKGGFTLIELMIVVAIIGILAAIAIPNFLRFQLKAKSSEGKTNLAAIRTAEESYYSEFGTYVSALASPPAATMGYNTKVAFSNADNGAVASSGGILTRADVGAYAIKARATLESSAVAGLLSGSSGNGT